MLDLFRDYRTQFTTTIPALDLDRFLEMLHNSPHSIPSYDIDNATADDTVEILITADEDTFNYVINQWAVTSYEIVGHIHEKTDDV